MQNLSHFLHFEFISRCHNPTNTNSAAFFLIEKVILSLNSCHKLADPDQCHNIVVKHVFIDFFITFDTLWNQIQNDVKPLMKEKSNLMFICNLEILLDNSPDYGHPMTAWTKEIWNFGPMWQTEYALAVHKSLGVFGNGSWFLAVQWRWFPHRASLVRGVH